MSTETLTTERIYVTHPDHTGCARCGRIRVKMDKDRVCVYCANADDVPKLRAERDARAAEVAGLREAMGVLRAHVNARRIRPANRFVSTSEAAFNQAIDDVLALIPAPVAAPAASGAKGAWVSVKERRPETSAFVVTYIPNRSPCEFRIASVESGYGGFVHPDGSPVSAVTHWMPLPLPPGADAEGKS